MIPNERPKPKAETAAEREARIDETLAETFPASDPPTWDTGADKTEPDEDSAPDV